MSAADLAALVADVRAALAFRASAPAPTAPPVTLYLVAATSLLAEGWRARVPALELAGDPPPALAAAVRTAAAARGIPVVWESPADVIPLPADWPARARPVAPAVAGPAEGPVVVRHFDPYSVVLRLVARGDESDYVGSLEYMRRGWVELGPLEALLADVLPRFTSETLAQDPAEFRRKFRGLRQLAASEAAGAGVERVLP